MLKISSRCADDFDVGNDRGSTLVFWLAKLTIGLAIAGVLFFDTFSIMSSQLSAQDQAQAIAVAAAPVWRSTQDIQKTYAAALAELGPDSPSTIDRKSFRVDPDGTVVVTVRRTASSYVLKYVGPLKKFTNVTATGESKASYS